MKEKKAAMQTVVRKNDFLEYTCTYYCLIGVIIENSMNIEIKKFSLERNQDPSGVSGVGIVAVGVKFPSGKCVLEWLRFQNSINVFDSIEDIEKIHGHNGTTRIIWETENNLL